ncbi:PREDICTED: protein FAM8A1-like [Amphimedon queenslandica]|uniref:RDD domain-containing protein n=1 Tax=Amphimedon queenslandica TaxID=400682 RepID=A0A1X7VQM8_AMPQE|nr:PREDICTED: protein FAM8A1-like [Amphimedon queenslandica]|eukprot:XP_011407619.1 PREDICTED: protein FAM8A1-like [Amphimedon queenslandica]
MADHTAKDSKPKFDMSHWYYCSLWWRNYLYWQSHLANSPQATTQPVYTPPFHPFQPPPVQVVGGARGPSFTVHIRLTTGFETYFAPLWRRAVAEAIDTLLVMLLLKWILPLLDFRIPEVLFLGTDEIMGMDDESIEEVAWTMIVFFISVILERTVHILMELLCCHKFGCTPGKWLLGLRVFNCTSLHYTQTDPFRTVKIEPGNKLGLWQSTLRAVFKSVVSLFCPLVIFFIVMDRGRPQYDRAFRTAVVHYKYLYRPI